MGAEFSNFPAHDPRKRRNVLHNAAGGRRPAGRAASLPGDADVTDVVLGFLEDRVTKRQRTEHFYFPAWVFDQTDMPSFAIGPVHFLRRRDWLDYCDKTAASALPWRPAVAGRWDGTRPTKMEKAIAWVRRNRLLQKIFRVNPRSDIADDIVRTIGRCPWVIAVAIEDQDRGRAKMCASAAASVALDTIGLNLARDLHRRLRGPGDETEVRLHYGLSQFNGAKGFNNSRSLDHPYLGGRPGDQAAFFAATGKLRSAAGAAIEAFTAVNPAGTGTHLKQRWVEAMYWFGQARREDNDFIALVKLGISLDILTQGRKAKGILDLCCAIRRETPDSQVTPDHLTLRQVVERLYNTGRSQIAHGGALALLRDLPLSLGYADSLTAGILTGYVACLEKYTGPDDTESFVGAIPMIIPTL